MNHEKKLHLFYTAELTLLIIGRRMSLKVMEKEISLPKCIFILAPPPPLNPKLGVQPNQCSTEPSKLNFGK